MNSVAADKPGPPAYSFSGHFARKRAFQKRENQRFLVFMSTLLVTVYNTACINMRQYIKLSYKLPGMKMNRHGIYLENIRNPHPRVAFKKGLVSGSICRSVWY